MFAVYIQAGRPSQAGPICEKMRHALVPASYAVIRNPLGHVLMLKRHGTGYCDGQWGLPSGHMEPGESPSACVTREVWEEVGLKVPMESFLPAHALCRAAINRVDFFFTLSRPVKDDLPTNMEPQKCSELGWFPLTMLPSNTIPYIKEALEAIQNGRSFSETSS